MGVFFFLGFHPFAISGYSEYYFFGIYCAGGTNKDILNLDYN
jgi:hypothetical protein